MKSKNKIQVSSPEGLPFDLNDFFGQVTLQRAADLFEQLERPFLNGKQIGISSRNLSHWVRVLNDNPETVWHEKYTFVDFVWFKMVEQLREMNVGFEFIRLLKQNLMKPIRVKGLVNGLKQTKDYIDDLSLSKEEKDTLLKLIATNYTKPAYEFFTILHVIIIDSVVHRLPLAVAAFSDGAYLILDRTKEHLYSEEERNRLLFDTHIRINISAILKEFLKSDLSGFVVPKIGLLSPAENKLFEVVHSGDYERIVIHFRDKKIKALDLKRSENVKERIVDILDKGAFAEIVIKKHKGVVTKIENTIKVTL